ncbi:MAG: BspA family leucine-rich repeat surface protein [Lachnospiraceae bacterium]|nr:BspA family leucine-rich repeat surface protein [Lachnospiraceae bacterium]
MQQTMKRGQVRRRLMAGLFCISLFAADLASAVPAWAKEPAAEAEQIQESGAEGTGEVQSPDGGKQDGTVQSPGGESDGDDASNPSGGNDGSQTQNPEEGNAGDHAHGSGESNEGDDASNPDEGNGGDHASGSGEGNEGDEVSNPDEGNGGDHAPGSGEENDGDDAPKPGEEGGVADDPAGKPGAPADDEISDKEGADSVSENDVEDVDSVSENDVEVYALAATADAIASGTYGNITWVVDANGKLTVEGTGDFAKPDNSVAGVFNRAPWCKSFNTYYAIKSAEIKVTGMTDASYMFYGCSNLTEVNLDGFDTNTVTNMRGMFSGCGKLESIDWEQSFHTGNVTNMSSMFYNCTRLKNINYKLFQTSNVTDMSSMFSGCRALENLDLSGWDTGKVTDMKYMFFNCGGDGRYKFDGMTLGGSFTTKSVKDMSYMFAYDESTVYDVDGNTRIPIPENQDRRNLAGLNLAWFDLSSVESMLGIFSECNIKELDLGRLDTSKTNTLSGLFANCDMTGVDFSGLRTDTITDMSRMFQNCKGTIDLHTLNTGNVTDMSSMFMGGIGGAGGYRPSVNSLTSLDLSGLNTANVTNMTDMFSAQEKLTGLNIGELDTSKVENTSGMFDGCSSLTQLDLSGVDFGNVAEMTGMFGGCGSLREIQLGNLGTAELHMIREEGNLKYLPVAEMFYGCTSLETLDMSNFNYEHFEAGWSQLAPLYNCEKLTKLYTPYNVPIDIAITGGDGYTGGENWYTADGTKLENNCLPKNLSYSVLIQKGSKPTVSAARLEVSKKKTLYGCGETITTDDLTVTYYGADGSVRKLAEGEYTTNVKDLSTNEPGTMELVIICNKDGNTLTKKLTLTVAHILTADNTTVTLPVEGEYSYIYDGKPKTPKPTSVSYTLKAAGGTGTPKILKEGTDYTLSYRNNINANEAGAAAAPVAVIKGVGSYSGTVSKSFAIGKADAPKAEKKNVIAAQCEQANPNRIIDLSTSYASYGKKTDYAVISVEDTNKIFSKTPATADIRNGVLTYGTNVSEEGKTASIRIKVSFQNYKDAELTVQITMAAKKAALISGIRIEDRVYNGAPVSHSGTASIKAEDGTDLTGKISLMFRYSGTTADDKPYPGQDGTAEAAPVNAGNYVLTVSVDEKDPDYTGNAEYHFQIKQASAVVRADDLVVLMKEAGEEGSGTIPADSCDFGYTVTGLLSSDALAQEPSYILTEDEAGKEAVTAIDRTKEGTYYIHPSGADAGMNYHISYRYGVLTVSEERVAYKVTLDGMGHCGTVTKSGIKAGSLLALTGSERTPEAEESGYVFAGWYKDKSFAKGKEWDFDRDTVQSDLTLYACWLVAAGEGGSGLNLCVQEIPDLSYTGSAQKPAVTVYDSDGKTLLKAGRDYTVKYANNTSAVEVGADGKPKTAGGTAKVENPGKKNEKITNISGNFSKECPYVVIAGKGNYTETIYRNFLILPVDIGADEEAASAQGAGNTALAPGFTLKYTDQFEAKKGKTAKIVTAFKYKKALKADQDYTVSVTDEAGKNVALAQGKLPLDAGVYTMTVTGKGNYTGTVTRELYVAERQKLMKNVSVTLGKKQRTHTYTGKDVLLTPGYYDAKEKKNYKVTVPGTVSSTPEGNADDMFLVKAGREGLVWGRDYIIDYTGNRAAGTAVMTLTGINGYAGSKSVTFKITGAAFSAKTIEVKPGDTGSPEDKGWKASLPYTGKALTQNKVTLTTKVTKNNPAAEELIYGRHYTITYKNNVKKGTATMTFTAKPESGYTGSFKKTFRITAQTLSKDRLEVEKQAQSGVPYSKNGAKLPFVIKNEAGTALREGVDYTVKYKNNSAVTTAQTPENKRPLMTVTGKGNYTGTVEVSFAITPISIRTAVDEKTVSVSCVRVQKKDSMNLKDFKLKLTEGKKALGVGENKDYVVDGTNCTPDIIKAYAEAVENGGASQQQEPSVKAIGRGAYTGEVTVPLGEYIYAEKLTGKNTYVVLSEAPEQIIYTGRQLTPEAAVYYGDQKAVSAAKQDKVRDEATLTAQAGKYKLTKLAAGDYTLSYGANIAAGNNKGSVTASGAGRYGGSVTVKFAIGKKAIY